VEGQREPSADANLLFGILSLQMDFITREQLVEGMNAWVLDKSKPLGRLLVERGFLSEQRFSVLQALVAEHLQEHDGDPEQSLRSIVTSSLAGVRQALDDVGDTELDKSLNHITLTVENSDATLTQSNVPRPEPGIGQRFRVLRPHAKGGVGQVSLARDEQLKREVALKEMLPRYAYDPLNRSRFLLEAEITGGLEHPGIVPVYGLGTYHDGRPYYAMRFLRGDNLKHAIDRYHSARSQHQDPGQRVLEFRRLLRRFVDVCNAMEYAHSRQVLHRDLKPGNVMLGKYGETMVVDWGMAKVFHAQTDTPTVDRELPPIEPSIKKDVVATSMGSTVGTPAYMSPEQAAGRVEELGPLSDVYGLGATLYHLLTGHPPVRDRDLSQVLRRVMRGDIPPARQIDPEIPKPLEAICGKAMALDPRDRYRSAVDLADDIEHWLADEPVDAAPDRAVDRVFRWVRRNRSWALTAAAALMLLTGVSVVSALLVDWARHSEQIAKEEAVAFLQSARQSLEMWVTDGSEALKYFPGTESVREKFLTRTARELEKFAKRQHGDRQLELQRGQALQALGTVRRTLGKPAEAENAYREALAIFVRYPAQADARYELANGQTQLALLLTQEGRHNEAATAYEEALQILRSLVSDEPERTSYQTALAATLLDRGVLLTQQGQLDEAARALTASVSDYEAIVARFTARADLRAALARARMALARAYLHHGSLDQAREHLSLAHRDLSFLHAEDRSDFDVLESLATADFELARLQGRTGRIAQQADLYRSAVERFGLLLTARPAWRPYVAKLASAEIEFGRVLHRLGSLDEADQYLRRAVVRIDPCVQGQSSAECVEIQTAGMDAITLVLSDRDQLQDARHILDTKILPAFAQLCDDHPRVQRYRERLAVSRAHLGVVLHQLGEFERARAALQSSLDELQGILAEPGALPRHRDQLATVFCHLTSLEAACGDLPGAEKAARSARRLWEHLVAEYPTAEYKHRLARFLLEGPVDSLLDAEAATRFAQQAWEESADNPLYATTLAAGCYRRQQWAAAGRCLDTAIRLRDGGLQAREGFYLAMMLWSRPNPDASAAEETYRLATAWMEQNQPGNLDLQRLRRQALAIRAQAASAESAD
jgi:serine/threonine-protein kinase